MGVARKFGTKVHIAAWRLEAYRELSELADCLTTDGASTRVHCCKFRVSVTGLGLPCGSIPV